MNRNEKNEDGILQYLSKQVPDAIAHIRGTEKYRRIIGILKLYQMPSGVFVVLAAQGMPKVQDPICRGGIFAVHIHDGVSCLTRDGVPLADVGAHYNPTGCAHPYHAGDLPPLFADDGYGWYAALTRRFSVEEVVGKVVIIHERPDDFTTQPSGNPGAIIACGVIKKLV